MDEELKEVEYGIEEIFSMDRDSLDTMQSKIREKLRIKQRELHLIIFKLGNGRNASRD